MPDIPEDVMEFYRARDRIEAFKARHHKLYTEFVELSEQFNQTLEAAERCVRERGIDAEGFQQLSRVETYNAEALYERVGHERFLEVGGTMETKRSLGIDKQRVRTAIATGQIDPDTARIITKVTSRYHTPKKVELP